MSKLAKSYLREEKVGKVTVREEITPSGASRFRTWAERKAVPKAKRRVNHASWEKAIEFAGKLNTEITKNVALDVAIDPVLEADIKEIARQINSANANREKKLSLKQFFQDGLLFLDALDEINSHRVAAGLTKYTVHWALHDWTFHAKAVSKRELQITYEKLIEQFLSDKLSKHGGRGNRELEHASKLEWKKYIGKHLKKWIGHLKAGTESRAIRDTIKNEINKAKIEKSFNKGQPWAQLTKLKCAKKISEFGNWLVKKEKLEKNPFTGLPDEFAYKSFALPKTLSVDEVKALFRVASKKKNRSIIPYLALAFYSGLRPEEIATANADRRLDWAQFEGWSTRSAVTGGLLFKVPCMEIGADGQEIRRSKISTERFADLTPSGIKWIEWFFALTGGELPSEGRISYSRRKLVRAQKEAGIRWVPSIARHTFFSFAKFHLGFKDATDSHWIEVAGHSAEVFKKHYKAPKDHAECQAYFTEIIPELICPSEEE